MCKTKGASSGTYYVARLGRITQVFNVRIESRKKEEKYLQAQIFIRLLRVISKMTTWKLKYMGTFVPMPRTCTLTHTHTDKDRPGATALEMVCAGSYK